MNEGEGVFQDAKIVWVMAMRAGKLLGFVKALKTKHELFIDEALVAAEERGKPHGLNTHMFRLLAQAIAGRLRLQVRETNPAIRSSRRIGFDDWAARAGSHTIRGRRARSRGQHVHVRDPKHCAAEH